VLAGWAAVSNIGASSVRQSASNKRRESSAEKPPNIIALIKGLNFNEIWGTWSKQLEWTEKKEREKVL
jgi:hypothetical protein